MKTEQDIEQDIEQYMVGKTILDQIRAIDSSAIMAWGAKNLLITNKNLGSLRFEISGCSKIKGKAFVEVELTPFDTYTITVSKTTNNQVKIMDVAEGVYCDELVYIIDSLVG